MMPADNPLVTVYMPTYNRASLLSRAIDSVLAQTYTNFELIIVDDGSADNTHEVLIRYAKQDSRIRYHINDSNKGACASRNRAIREAKGKFITGLDDDDYFLPNRLETFIDAWVIKPREVILLYSLYSLKGTSSIYTPNPIRKSLGKIICSKDLLESFYTGSQIFTTKAILCKVGLYDENLPMWQDFDLYYRVLELGKGMRVSKCTYIVDSNHAYERITSSRVRLVNETYDHLVKKYDFTYKEAILLQARMFLYGDEFIKFKPSLYKFMNRPSRYSLKMVTKSIYLSFKRLSAFK